MYTLNQTTHSYEDYSMSAEKINKLACIRYHLVIFYFKVLRRWVYIIIITVAGL